MKLAQIFDIFCELYEGCFVWMLQFVRTTFSPVSFTVKFQIQTKLLFFRPSEDIHGNLPNIFLRTLPPVEKLSHRFHPPPFI